MKPLQAIAALGVLALAACRSSPEPGGPEQADKADKGGSDIANLPVEHGGWRPPADLDAPPQLDLRGARLTFEDRFAVPDVVPDGQSGRWFAPVHNPFGTARFLPPVGGDSPFSFGPAGLTVRASKGPNGRWRTGTMQTVDGQGRGFAQRYGYFEMRAQLPSGYATWPSFWLLTQNGYTDHSRTRGEIDVFEGYGGDGDRLHATIHLWPARLPNGTLTFPKHWFASTRLQVRGMQTGFHDYGVAIGPQWTVFYFDRHEILRRPTLPEYKTPFYMLITLAMDDKKLDQTPSPQDLRVQWVRAYSLPRG